MQTVLIVDDMAVVRAPLAAALSAAGFHAVTAESGQEALTKIRSTPPDLVLLDLTMPGIDGLTVLRTLRGMPTTAKLPVIVLTASSAKHLVIEAAKVGIQDYLVKSGSMLSLVVSRVQKCVAGAAPTKATAPAPVAAAATPVEPPAPNPPPAPAPLSINSALSGIPTLGKEDTTRRIDRAEVRSLPRSVMDLISLIYSGKGSAAEASQFLQRDPVLFARLLRVANARALSNQQARITTVDEAVQLFGAEMVQNLIVAFSVFEIVSDRTGGKGNPPLWNHSLAVASLMEKFAVHAGLPAGAAYVLGLCHELPEVMLYHHFPKHFRHATELAHRTGEPLQLAQENIFGMRHSEMMHLLLNRLKLPTALANSLDQFFDTKGAAPTAKLDPLARLLRLADGVAHGLMIAPSPETLIGPFPSTLVASAFGEKLPEINPAALREEVDKMASLLVETSNPAALELLLPNSGSRVLYIRDEDHAELDPLLLLLQATSASVHVHVGLAPLPTTSHEADAVVIAAPSATPAAELVSLVHCLSEATRGRPVLCLSGVEYARSDGGIGAEVKTITAPATLNTLGAFLAPAPAVPLARAA